MTTDKKNPPDSYGKLYTCIEELDLSLIAFYLFGRFVMETWRGHATVENPNPKEFSLTREEMAEKYKKSVNTIKKGMKELVDLKVLQVQKRGNQNIYTLGEFVLNKINEKKLLDQKVIPLGSEIDPTFGNLDQKVIHKGSKSDPSGSYFPNDNRALSAPESYERSIERGESAHSSSALSHLKKINVDGSPDPVKAPLDHEKADVHPGPLVVNRVIWEIENVIATDGSFESLSIEAQGFVLSELKGNLSLFDSWKRANKKKSFNGIIGDYFKKGGAKNVFQKPKLEVVLTDNQMLDRYQQALITCVHPNTKENVRDEFKKRYRENEHLIE